MSRRMNIGVIGCGRVGITHIEAVRALSEKVSLYCVVDQNKELADKVGEKYGTRVFYEVKEALQEKELDAVVVALPHYLHQPISVLAMEAGKHVLCEKPLARNYDEAKIMYKVARQNNVTLMSGQSRRFFKALQKTKEIVKTGGIGTPLSMLYNFTCYFDEKTAPVWWKDENKVGGLVLPMLGSHSVDFCLWLFEDKKPISVYAVASKRHHYFEGADEGVVVIRFDDGSTATSYLSVNNYPAKHECQIIGRKGNIFFSHVGDHSGLIGTAATDLYLNGKKIMTGEQTPTNFTLQLEEFIDSIVQRREPSVRPAEIQKLMYILDLARKSSETNEVVLIEEIEEI